MDKTLLNLLFNYKGEVTYRQMQAATVVLFIALSYSFYPMINSLFANIVMGQMGAEWLATYTHYSRVISSFIPNFIPAWFIVSYSAFIISYKRVRTIGKSKAVAILSGISTYLFLASLTSLPILYSMQSGFAYLEENSILNFIDTLPFVEGAFVLVGIINLVLLCTRNSSEQMIVLESEEGNLGVFPYIMKLGMIMVAFAIGSLVMGFILMTTPGVLENSPFVIYIPTALLLLGAMIFYLRYSVFRMRDAQVPVYWMTVIVIFYFVLAIARGVLVTLASESFVYFNSFYEIVTSFVMAAQFLLLFLSSKPSQELE